MTERQHQQPLLDQMLRCCIQKEDTGADNELDEVECAREVRHQPTTPSLASSQQCRHEQRGSAAGAQHQSANDSAVRVVNNPRRRSETPPPAAPTALPATSKRYQRSKSIHIARQANIKNEVDNRQALLQAMRAGSCTREFQQRSLQRQHEQYHQHGQQPPTCQPPPSSVMLPQLTFESFVDIVRQDFERKVKDRAKKVRRSLLGPSSIVGKSSTSDSKNDAQLS